MKMIRQIKEAGPIQIQISLLDHSHHENVKARAFLKDLPPNLVFSKIMFSFYQLQKLLIVSSVLILHVNEIECRRISKIRSTISGTDDQDDENDDEAGRISLGSFQSYAHSLAGDVTILDEKTMEISGLIYDGLGPAAWFMLGKTTRSSLPEFIELDGIVIPDENDDCETLKQYNRDDITLKLPGKMKFSDYDYISMYCVRFNHNFGYVTIPDEMKLKNGTLTKELKECDQDDLDEAGDSRERPGGGRPQAPPPPPSSFPSSGGSLIGGLLNRIIG